MSLDRNSHVAFFAQRDFSTVQSFWKHIVRLDELPPFITGYDAFSVTNLSTIHDIGHREYGSTDPRHKRKTFAVRVGYDGSQYHGYQAQKGVSGVRAVADDIESALGRKVSAAGRTDKGVSAVSQVVSFTTFDDIEGGDVMRLLKASEGCISGRLNAWECVRVPRKFHSLFSASFRRYIYLFPLVQLNDSPSTFDVDVDFVNKALTK